MRKPKGQHHVIMPSSTSKQCANSRKGYIQTGIWSLPPGFQKSKTYKAKNPRVTNPTTQVHQQVKTQLIASQACESCQQCSTAARLQS